MSAIAKQESLGWAQWCVGIATIGLIAVSAVGCKRAPRYHRDGLQCTTPDADFVAVEGGGKIMRRAVTARDFECCAQAGKCSPETFLVGGQRCTVGNDDKADHPANCLSWRGAAQYCSYLKAELPTAALWLRAAGGARKTYPWGDEPPIGRANCDPGVCKDKWAVTAPVTAFATSAASNGALQLAGNVFAWQQDWYQSASGTSKQVAAPPKTFKVLKGGSWREHDHAMRNDALHYKRPNEKLANIGLRCARSK